MVSVVPLFFILLNAVFAECQGNLRYHVRKLQSCDRSLDTMTVDMSIPIWPPHRHDQVRCTTSFCDENVRYSGCERFPRQAIDGSTTCERRVFISRNFS